MQKQPDRLSGYLAQDTITAPLTGMGGAVTVIRISGPDAFPALVHLTRQAEAARSEPRKLVLAEIFSPTGEPLDQVLYVRFVQPHSFTGEDVVELHLHGSSFIGQRVLETLVHFGIRHALPGEFSFRAVRNGKISLFQAQAIADLITASNDKAVSLALEKMSGAQNDLIQKLSDQLRHLASMGEIGIDFADQDVEEVSLPSLKKQIIPLLDLLQNLKDSFQRGYRIQEGIPVVFVGLPNAGKSSFFNAILGEDRSIVSDIAGTTRDVIREQLTLRGRSSNVTLRLEDTAGLRETHNPIEKMGIERTLKACQMADVILFLVDPTAPIESVLEQWNTLVNSFGISSDAIRHKTLGIITKLDQITPAQQSEIQRRLQTLSVSSWSFTSSKTGEGIPEAIESIIQYCENLTHRSQNEVLLTRVEHLEAIKIAINDLERAQTAPEIDLFASDLRQALYSLSPLIGTTVPDDILGKIFSNFCIGK